MSTSSALEKGLETLTRKPDPLCFCKDSFIGMQPCSLVDVLSKAVLVLQRRAESFQHRPKTYKI